MKRLLVIIILLVFTLYTLPFTLVSDVTSGSTTTAFVPPQSNSFQLSLTEDVPYPVHEDTTMTYAVTYGVEAFAGVTANNVLTVNFGQNTFDGVTPVADYVIGSATNGFNGAQPVVDLINHKITWTLSNMPPGSTDQIVTFQLRTNSKYTGLNEIPIITTANMYNQYVTMPQQTHQINYKYQQPTNPVKPTSTPSPQQVVTPTPAAATGPKITDISFSEVSADAMTLHVATSENTRLSAFYGLSPNAMSNQIVDARYVKDHAITITNLNKNAAYYLQFTITNASGISYKSEIITFKTATTQIASRIDQQSVILVSGNNPLISANPNLPFAQVLIPNTKNYTIGLRITSPDNIKNIIAFVENAHVLGVNTFDQTIANSFWSAPMVEQQPGVFIAQLAAPPTPSVYDVFAKISDKNGNISQSKIAEAIVYGPVHVVDKKTDSPIEHARLYLSQYSKSKKDYQPILSSDIQENPTFTDKNGLVILNTGGGMYKITVSQAGYKSQTIYFKIDKTHIIPPVVHLENVGISLSSLWEYYSETSSDFIEQALLSLQNFSSTFRYFKLISIFVTLSLVIVTFLLFLIRTKLSIIIIPLFIKHHAKNEGSVHGQILDAITHQVIPLAVVAVSNKATHEVLMTTTTNSKGIFYLNSQWISSDNNLNILAQGYRTNKFAIDEAIFPAVVYLHHNLVGGPIHHPLIATIIKLVGLFFETALVLSLIMEIFFIPTIGLLSLLFVGLSLGTLLLWILYQRGTEH